MDRANRACKQHSQAGPDTEIYVTVTENDGTKICAFFTVSNLRRWYEREHDNAYD